MQNIDINNYNILLIDDDIEYCENARIYLTSLGFNILTQNNSIEAMEYIKSHHTDIILLDYFMPYQNGEEFLEKLREFNTETIVILQTGCAIEKPQAEMIKKLNIQGYYNKTQNVDILIALLYSAIKQVVLLQEVKKYEFEKHIRDLKDKFYANKIKNIHSEIRNPLMLIGGNALAIEDFIENNNLENTHKEILKKQISYSREASSNIYESIEALDISSENTITVNMLLKKIKLLLNSDIIKNGVEITIDIPKQYFFVNSESGYTPFIIGKILLELINAGNKKIDLIAKIADNKMDIEILIQKRMSPNIENEIKLLTEVCNNLKFNSATYTIELKKFIDI